MTEKMKPSGIAWIGEIPTGWDVKRVKYVIQNNADGIKVGPFGSALTNEVVSSEEGQYKIYGQANLIRKDFNYGDNFVTEENYRRLINYEVLPDDIAVSMMGTIGKCSVVPYGIQPGIMDSHLIKIRLSKKMSPRFFEYIYESCVVYEQLVVNSKGSIMNGLNSTIVKSVFLAVPSIDEQTVIADFLDAQCAKIDSVIANIEKQIETLQKYKKSMITEAVTKGLDQSVQMKDSGCKWVSHIPMHWSIKRFKYLLNYITDGSHFSPETVDEGCPFITAADVRGLGLDYQSAKKISNQDFIALQRTGCQPKMGDVLLVKDGATTGRIGMVTSDYPCVVLSSVAILRAPESMDCRYLRYLMESEFVQSQIQASMAGSAMPRTVLSKIVNYLGIECPKDEQIRICDYLDKKCANIDSIISQKEKQLEAITKHKKSLIYEYVTGKKRVTEVN
jgi:type I restriction enzyme S subunit